MATRAITTKEGGSQAYLWKIISSDTSQCPSTITHTHTVWLDTLSVKINLAIKYQMEICLMVAFVYYLT